MQNSNQILLIPLIYENPTLKVLNDQLLLQLCFLTLLYKINGVGTNLI